MVIYHGTKETNQLKQIQDCGEFVCPCLVFTRVESLFFELPVSVKLLRRWMTYQLLSTNLLRAIVKGGHY